MAASETRPTVRLAATLLIVIATAVGLEGISRLAYAYREDLQKLPLLSHVLQRDLDLDAYEMPSPDGGYHWVLRPGYEADAARVIDEKTKAGRIVGRRALEGAGVTAGMPALRINRDGFKGPEIDGSHSNVRILALGDSTTFGMGGLDYPRAMEAALGRKGVAAEVVNGGVEGYAPRNLLREMGRYGKPKPQIATLYIGWNALFSRNPDAYRLEGRIRLVWAGRRVGRMLGAIVRGKPEHALSLYNREMKPDRRSPEVADLDSYRPLFLGDVEKVIDGLQAMGARVVLVTLPGLFTMQDRPTAKALKMGHLPEFTDNPYVLAAMTGRYNEALRALGKRRGLKVIDLAVWSRTALKPREAYFSDSVHLTPEGLEKIGHFMAEQLAPLLADLAVR